ncbi:DUF397 domain-containing protein [Streptomyces sp. NPDC046915]|uniref:DUF397 domain-containing protein n=1 Tax=Streptomyces sp. NPDC046915 TaxID=3155257 RepID=UPI0033C26ECC
MSVAEPFGSNRLVWFTSSYSNGAGGECVECAWAGGSALVRDSKNSNGAVVAVEQHTWQAFVDMLRREVLGDA